MHLSSMHYPNPIEDFKSFSCPIERIICGKDQLSMISFAHNFLWKELYFATFFILLFSTSKEILRNSKTCIYLLRSNCIFVQHSLPLGKTSVTTCFFQSLGKPEEDAGTIDSRRRGRGVQWAYPYTKGFWYYIGRFSHSLHALTPLCITPTPSFFPIVAGLESTQGTPNPIFIICIVYCAFFPLSM